MSLASFLSEHGEHFELLPSNRIRCKVTQHEMPCDSAVVEAYQKGKKFMKALKWYQSDFSKYEPNIIPHKSNPKALYCTITSQTLNKIPQEVEKHVCGKKYLRLKKESDERVARKAAKEEKKRLKAEAWAKTQASKKEDKKDSETMSTQSEDDSDEEGDFWKPDGISEDEEDSNDELHGGNMKMAGSSDDDDESHQDSDEEDWIFTTSKLQRLREQRRLSGGDSGKADKGVGKRRKNSPSNNPQVSQTQGAKKDASMSTKNTKRAAKEVMAKKTKQGKPEKRVKH